MSKTADYFTFDYLEFQRWQEAGCPVRLPAAHEHTLKRYEGLQKFIDYCDCGFEQEVHPDDRGFTTPNNESSRK